MRTSFHHQPEAQHFQTFSYPQAVQGRLPHLLGRWHPNNLHRTYFAKKIRTYYQASEQLRFMHDLGIPNFRVATVTTTAERMEKMLEALKLITDGRGSNMFLFTTR